MKITKQIHTEIEEKEFTITYWGECLAKCSDISVYLNKGGISFRLSLADARKLAEIILSIPIEEKEFTDNDGPF